MDEFVTRAMTVDDAELIGQHREQMFRDNEIGGDALAKMRAPFVEWVRRKLGDGSYLGWAVMLDGAVVAGVGVMVLDWPPHPQHPTDGRRGYVLNMYVADEMRGKGLARRLMLMAADECRALGIEYAVLHASPMGKPVYERMGWKQTNEMALSLVGRAGTSADTPRSSCDSFR